MNPIGKGSREICFLFFGKFKKKHGTPDRESRVARRKGLEPLTYWFVANHSIQLS